jgi:hypothetical protein
LSRSVELRGFDRQPSNEENHIREAPPVIIAAHHQRMIQL